MKKYLAIPFFLSLLLTSLVGCGITNSAIEKNQNADDNVNEGFLNVDRDNGTLNNNGNGMNDHTGTGTGTERNDEDYLYNETNENKNLNKDKQEFNLPGTGG